MAGKTGSLEKRRKEMVVKCSKVFNYIASRKAKPGKLVKDIAKELGFPQDAVYHALKRLYLGKRLQRATVDGYLWWEVLDTSPITLEEIVEQGDPYKREQKRKAGRKRGSKNKPKPPAVIDNGGPKPQLKQPMVIYGHPSDANIKITLDGAPEACAIFLRQLGRGQ